MRCWGLQWASVVLVCSLLLACVPADNKKQRAPDEKPFAARSSLDRAVVHTDLGSAYYASGQYGVALEELNAAVAADSRYAPAYNGLGLVYMALREDKKAQANFEQSLRIDSKNSSANNNYGLLLCQIKREKEGIERFLVALKDPLYDKADAALTNAGVCSRTIGDDKGAEEFFNKAIALQPNNAPALFNLAELKYKSGEFTAARGFLKRYLQNSQPQADSLWLGARIENRLGDSTARSSYGSQLKNRFPDSPEAKAFEAGSFKP